MNYHLPFAGLLAAIGLGSCCLPFPPKMCDTVDPFPTVEYFDAAGTPIRAGTEDTLSALAITDVSNITTPSADITWRVSDNYGGEGFPQENSFLQLVNDGAYVEIERGTSRINTYLVTYTYAQATYVDTMRIESSWPDERCCSRNLLDYESFEYTGPLVRKVERRNDIPGFTVYLREP